MYSSTQGDNEMINEGRLVGISNLDMVDDSGEKDPRIEELITTGVVKVGFYKLTTEHLNDEHEQNDVMIRRIFDMLRDGKLQEAKTMFDDADELAAQELIEVI